MVERLEKTLADRLRAFESERDRTRQIVGGILRRIRSLESEFGLSMAECHGECHQALSDIEALDPYAKDSAAEIEPVLRRFARIAALLEGLDVPALLAAAEDRA